MRPLLYKQKQFAGITAEKGKTAQKHKDRYAEVYCFCAKKGNGDFDEQKLLEVLGPGAEKHAESRALRHLSRPAYRDAYVFDLLRGYHTRYL